MHARDAIAKLLEQHAELLGGLSARKLARETRIDASQLSRWLNQNGAMSVEREGLVTQKMLDLVDLALAGPSSKERVRELESLAKVLRGYGPRRRLAAASADAAFNGDPISRSNRHYMERKVDEDLRDRLKLNSISLSIIGGPKTGRSSLLLAAQEWQEGSASVLFVDLAEFVVDVGGTLAIDYEHAESQFSRWFSEKCEMQLSGHFQEQLASIEGFTRWLRRNLLPNAMAGKCLLLLDGIESLSSELDGEHLEFRVLDRMLFKWITECAVEPALSHLGVVVGLDLDWLTRVEGGHRSDYFRSRGFRSDIDNLTERQVLTLIRSYDFDDDQARDLLRSLWQDCGGHAFLTQRCLVGARISPAEIQIQLVNSIQELAHSALTRWGPEFCQLVVDEIDVVIKCGKEQNGAARNALKRSGLCVSTGPAETLAPGYVPLRPVNRENLLIFQAELKSRL